MKRATDIDQRIARDIESAGKEALTNLAKSIALSASLTENSYAIKLRPKTVEGLLKKLEVKWVKKPEYSLMNITDVVGLRVVTLFRSQMIDVVRDVLRLINEDLCPYIINGSIEELKVYKANRAKDDVSSKIMNVLDEMGLQGQLVQAENHTAMYSSIHIVARMSERAALERSSELKEYWHPIEIQIRTAFEDVWSEIDHWYGYSARSGKDINQLGDLTPVQEAHLKILKSFTDASADYAEAIKLDREASSSQVVSTIMRMTVQDAITDRLIGLGVPEGFIDRYSEITDRVQSREKNGLSQHENIAIANQYHKLLVDAKNPESLIPTEGMRLLSYYVQMNEAISRLVAGTPQQARRAIEIYSTVLTHYPDYPLPYFRMGQAYSDLERYGQASECFNKAKELYEPIKNAEETTVEWVDKMPETEPDVFSLQIRRFQGYMHWEIFKRSRKFNEKEAEWDHLKLALELTQFAPDEFSTTERGVEYEEAWSDAVNNVLSYSVALLDQPELDLKEKENLEAQAQTYMEYLTNAIDVETCDDVQYLDTLHSAHARFGNVDASIVFANRITDMLEGGIVSNERLTPSELPRSVLALTKTEKHEILGSVNMTYRRYLRQERKNRK